MQNIRQAALAIHKLGEVDRSWLMSQLSTDQQQALSVLLQELRELGISSYDVEATLSEARPEPVFQAPDSNVLNRCSVQAVFAALVEEPDAAVAVILVSAPWLWLHGVLAEFEKIGRAERIRLAMRETTVSPRFSEKMVEQLTCDVIRRDAERKITSFEKAPAAWLGRIKRVVGPWHL